MLRLKGFQDRFSVGPNAVMQHQCFKDVVMGFNRHEPSTLATYEYCRSQICLYCCLTCNAKYIEANTYSNIMQV